MALKHRVSFLVVPMALTLLCGFPTAGAAETTTLWNFLGIPQAFHKMRDVSVNRRGNHPGLERKDPLKRIADPANLESENPAIQKAAEIKKEEDLKKQKIKAIKYLATVGCGCYEGVGDALLAALSDCTEEVRYEAAVALCQVAGCGCDTCGTTCCNAEVMQKLHEMAYCTKENGCPVEASCRVRQAAANALNACKSKLPASPGPVKADDDKIIRETQVNPRPVEPTPTVALPGNLRASVDRPSNTYIVAPAGLIRLLSQASSQRQADAPAMVELSEEGGKTQASGKSTSARPVSFDAKTDASGKVSDKEVTRIRIIAP